MYNLGNGTGRQETGLAPADFPYPEQVTWAFSWGSNSPEQLVAYDINADGQIDAADIALAFAGQTPTGATSAGDRAYVEKHQAEFGEEAVEAVRETTLALDLIRAEEEKLRLREEELNQRDRLSHVVKELDQETPVELSTPIKLPTPVGIPTPQVIDHPLEVPALPGTTPVIIHAEPVATSPQRPPAQGSPVVPIVLLGAAFLLLR